MILFEFEVFDFLEEIDDSSLDNVIDDISQYLNEYFPDVFTYCSDSDVNHDNDVPQFKMGNFIYILFSVSEKDYQRMKLLKDFPINPMTDLNVDDEQHPPYMTYKVCS